MGIIVTFIALLIVTFITYYGQNAGNFVLSIDEDLKDRNVYMSETVDFINPTAMLQADAVYDARDITYSFVNIDEAVNTDGTYKDPYFKYVAYTFYIKNFGYETTDLEYTTTINSVSDNVDKAIRIMVITQYQDVVQQKIYMAKDDVEYDYEDIPECIEFLSEKMVMQEKITGFFPDEQIKFTVFMWLEGQDPDTNDSILGGKVKLQLRFSCIDSESEQ